MGKIYLRKVPEGDYMCRSENDEECYFYHRQPCDKYPCLDYTAIVYIPIPESEAKEIMFQRMLRKLEAVK